MLPFNPSDADIARINIERKQHMNKIVRIRFQVLYFVFLGVRRGKSALLAGCHRNSVTNYIKMYNQGGLESIAHLDYVGPEHPLVNRIKEVEDKLEQLRPCTLADVAKMLKDHFEYDRSTERVRVFLHSIGIRRRKVGSFPGKPKDLEEWLKKQKGFKLVLDNLLQRAEKQEIDMVFADAAHFVYGKFSNYLWSKEPKLSASGHGRYRINVYSAYDPVTKQVASAYNEGYINAEFMVAYFNILRTEHYPDYSKSLHVVLDNARYQHCKYVKEVAKNLNITLEFLPGYSPNLNLIERLWKYMKSLLAKQTHDSKDSFSKAIVSILENLWNDEHQQSLESLLTFKFQDFENAQILTC